jgi:hypothetical protein
MAVDLLCLALAPPLRTGRRYGQIIDAKQVPHKGWGADEGWPAFFVVRVTDRNLADVASIVGQREELEDKGATVEGFRIRAAGRIDTTRLTRTLKDRVQAGQRLNVTWDELKAAVMDDLAEARRRYAAKDPTWPPRVVVSKAQVQAQAERIEIADRDTRKDR